MHLSNNYDFLSETWKLYSERTLDLMAASLVTNVAFKLSNKKRRVFG
jgi:hypothetical protein